MTTIVVTDILFVVADTYGRSITRPQKLFVVMEAVILVALRILSATINLYFMDVDIICKIYSFNILQKS